MKEVIRSYAKINLFLDVLNKRPDGYHNIGSLFQGIDLYDEIEFELTENLEIEFSSNLEITPEPSQNIIFKAAQALQEKMHQKKGVRIFLNKKCPMGAGLGAGSANASETLQYLNLAWNVGLTTPELMEIGAKLGADVPFFIQKGTAWGEGIGDELYACPIESDVVLAIITPQDFVSTAKAYSLLSPSGEDFYFSQKNKIKSGYKTATQISEILYNKFEESVFEHYPRILRLKNYLLKQGAEGALLSGSGASVFGLFESEAEAQKALDLAPEEPRFKAVARFLNI